MSNDEHLMQRSLVEAARLLRCKHPEYELLLAIPNGGARHARVGAQMKAEGVRRGVPDLLLPVQKWPYAGLWLEMKTPVGKLSEHQKWWCKALTMQGHAVAVCRSVEAALIHMDTYLSAPGHWAELPGAIDPTNNFLPRGADVRAGIRVPTPATPR